ncbi:sensor histidine kinase [Clostridium sp. SYSU_GA19001]|uniref:sensor histidine kinase n=1 Tax=Clostridium caldaquaticum TaxID=2940653 RepID=UPI0020774564|nr:sensor histidine kinase [Clostridium caldaquaticum]MCM8709487.1 sensor histidine kinase [Clostridium caldaquaticum]
MRKLMNKITNFITLKSIQSIITVSFAIITVIAMVFVSVILSGKFSSTAKQNISRSTMQVIEQVGFNIENYKNSMIDIVNLIDESINKVNTTNSPDLIEKLDVILDMRDDIVSIALFSDKGNLIMGDPFSKLKNNADIVNQEWFIKAVENNGEVFISSPHVQNLFEVKHNWVISLSKAVTFNQGSEKINGVLLIDLNFSSIEQLCQKVSLGKRGYMFIVDSKGNFIYHPQQQLIYLGLKNEDVKDVLKTSYGTITQYIDREERLATVKTIGNSEWKITGISYLDEFYKTKKDITNFSVLILLFAMVFIVLIFIIISAKITKPIRQLDNSMKKLEEGDFNTTVHINGDKEVVHLAKTFNIMVSKIKQLMEQIVVEQEAKRRSELNALQAQINPHFLYNTLDSIVWMAENGKIEDVITMVTSLARLFRISISRGKNIITVKEEIEHAKNYLIIQKIRFKSKFRFNIEVEEEVLQYKTLKLILQPIIENALYHGIQYMVEEGVINVSAKTVDNKLLYEVTDNGLGIKPEVLENILSYNSKENGGAGVGVRNVHERIQIYYGKEYGLEIQSELEEGTRVKFWLPIEKDENDEK